MKELCAENIAGLCGAGVSHNEKNRPRMFTESNQSLRPKAALTKKTGINIDRFKGYLSRFAGHESSRSSTNDYLRNGFKAYDLFPIEHTC